MILRWSYLLRCYLDESALVRLSSLVILRWAAGEFFFIFVRLVQYGRGHNRTDSKIGPVPLVGEPGLFFGVTCYAGVGLRCRMR